ncbi:early activation antigen CD69-like [Hirundo rustica]|uniref:early activation antigen CD69-like n=1 Tax=Hirundo rustica TaxID=43150 RepID=UPI001A952298|nr:early activation antigen CD69-like [Hirundo rustica]
MSLSVCHHRGCEAVPEADLREAFSALLMCREQGAVCSQQRDAGCELEESEFCSVHGVVKEPLPLQEGPAAGLTHLPGAQEATCHKQGDATCECAVSEDVENGFCTSDGSVREILGPQGTSATDNVHRRSHRRFPGKWFRSHPVVVLVLTVLVFLVLALLVALAVQSAPQVPVPAATPLLVLGCPSGWVGYNGVCYYFSWDHGTWDQGQERCSELGASLAIVKDMHMDLLFRLRGNVDFWLGLRRRGERLQWGDGSDFSSWVPVLGDSECVYLADNEFRSESCSNQQPYLCSKAQAPL